MSDANSWISEQTKEVLSKALGKEYKKPSDDVHPELQRLHDLKREIVTLTPTLGRREARPYAGNARCTNCAPEA